MSIFKEFILTKIFEIQKQTAKNFNDELKAILESGDKLEEEFLKGRNGARSKAQHEKTLMTTLQSIHEDDDEPSKTAAKKSKTDDEASTDSEKRMSKKRSKDEVDGISNHEVDKRQKRNASVKAQSIISKQVNVNLTQKMRRESSMDKSRRGRRNGEDKENAKPLPTLQIKLEKISLPPEPMDMESLPINVEVKNEPNKDDIAMPPPVAPVPKPRKALQKEKSAESSEDESGTKKRGTRGRKATETAPPSAESSEDESGTKKRGTRGRKATETMPPPPEPSASARSTRASSRASSRATRLLEDSRPDDVPPAPEIPEGRPKRTRGRKKASAVTPADSDKETAPQENGIGSPADKPRPKRTRRAQKAAELESQSSLEQAPPTKLTQIQMKEEPISRPVSQSPVLQKIQKPTKNTKKANEELKTKLNKKDESSQDSDVELKTKANKKDVNSQDIEEKTKANKKYVNSEDSDVEQKTKSNKKDVNTQNTEEKTKATKKYVNSQDKEIDYKTKTNKKDNQKTKANKKEVSSQDSEIDGVSGSKVVLNETRVLEQGDMDKTMVLPNGVYNHAPVTPKTVNANETVVLESHDRQTLILQTHANAALDATVVLDKVADKKAANITEDNSLLTDDSEPEMRTPPMAVPPTQPTSAVKEKVQQFEELAARTTRTKTRAMAKMEEPDNQTPPDKIIKPVLSAETLSKMNSMIFNGKPPQISSSASKPRVIPPPKPLPASTSKLSSISRHRDAAEEAKREKEDARKKKEAMLEAKRELQKKKREEKMAAAAAAREAAEKERKMAMEQAARERMEKQAHADLGKLERLKEVERKKHELARKVAETEERRRAEEQARQQRLADEQRKAELARRKQLEEAEAMKKEAALMAKEMEKRQKEYFEKQKMNKMHTPLKTPGTPGYWPQEPVYMADGFEHLNSDEDSEPPQRPVPAWSTVKMRRLALVYQSEVSSQLIDRLFSVRVHSVDLREIFPNIERARLKRTSSAVWRTPPARGLPALPE